MGRVGPTNDEDSSVWQDGLINMTKDDKNETCRYSTIYPKQGIIGMHMHATAALSDACMHDCWNAYAHWTRKSQIESLPRCNRGEYHLSFTSHHSR